MKKMLSAVLLLALCLLAACGAQGVEPTPEVTPTPELTPTPTPEVTPQPGQFVFTRENFPRMDGSTSLVPLAESMAAVLLGESREEAAELIKFNRTTQSYRHLMWDQCDILVAATPADTIMQEYKDNNFQYEMAKIASDALIFVVNADNPVDSLTVEQVQKIYTGEITNWSEVGGADVEIIPFQRNAEAGSQTSMLKLVMNGLEMMEPPTDYVVDSMMGLMEAVRSFDGSNGAIGYSVYYYANAMRMAEGLKIIAINGVEPDAESIGNESYPFLASYYTTIAADEPAGSPARVMFEWLQSEEGKALIEAMDYVPVAG